MRVEQKISDAELVRKTVAGDDSAFAMLESRYNARLHSYAFRKMGYREDAQDIVQEAFFEAYQGLQKLERPEKFSGWIFVIASRLITKAYRKREKQVACTPLSHRADTADLIEVASAIAHRRAEQNAEITDLLDEFEIAIDRLPDSLREPLRLRNADMSYQEIAQAMDITENAVKRRIARARKKLGALVGGNPPDWS
ncbi:MAG: RNA polymerase sigma factor [Candidatus Poribacteria bacterium]|nr:RNA polymerase sigma factor [Candidatus Poribacteria bacterium]